MKILMTTDTLGGVWTYSLELIKGLTDQGVHVSLATQGRPLSADQWRQVAAIDHLEIHESQYRLEWMQHPWKDVDAAGRWLLELNERIQPDLIHLNDYAHAALNFHRPVLVVGHSCVTSWMHAVRRCAPDAGWDEYRQRVTAGLQAADLVVAPTRWMLAELVQHYGNLPASRVIHNGRTLPRQPQTQRQPFILSAGRLWDDAKNVALLAEISERVEWPVCVAGSHQHPDDGSTWPGGPLKMLGQLTEAGMQQAMASAALYVLPAKYEPFGLTALEAASQGCPLLLSSLETLRELWSGAALFESPDRPDAWAKRLNFLIRRPTARAQLGRLAERRAAVYSRLNMACEYQQAYRWLIAQSECCEVITSTQNHWETTDG